MALENKKLSTYGDLASASIDATTQLVVLTENVKVNKNLPISNLLVDTTSGDSSYRALSQKGGKVISDAVALRETVLNVSNGLAGKAPIANATGGANNYAPLASPTFTGNIIAATQTFADNTAAASLPTGTVYKTSTGVLMIKY
jgi:hypothetical protein